MLSTKIRTTIIALIAASSFAVASTAPAVSQAAKNTEGFSKSSESKFCSYTWGLFESYVNKADAAHKAGNLQATRERLNEAQETVNNAKAEGCGWAFRVAPPAQMVTPLPAGNLAP